MRTRSLAKLKINGRYWGNFSQNKDGILAINNLKKKPEVLQNELEFFEIPSWEMVETICKSELSFFKNWILNSLEICKNKNDFSTLTSMLLALNEGIVHLPFKINKRPFLIQYKAINKTLNKNLIDFYFAFDTIAAVRGRIGNEIEMKVLYEKSANLLSQNYENKLMKVGIADTIMPLWKGNGGLLDEAG